jgi:hypothetical protein
MTRQANSITRYFAITVGPKAKEGVSSPMPGPENIIPIGVFIVSTKLFQRSAVVNIDSSTTEPAEVTTTRTTIQARSWIR